MIIAAGAVRTPIIAVQKLGFAMMESVRKSFFIRVSRIHLLPFAVVLSMSQC